MQTIQPSIHPHYSPSLNHHSYRSPHFQPLPFSQSFPNNTMSSVQSLDPAYSSSPTLVGTPRRHKRSRDEVESEDGNSSLSDDAELLNPHQPKSRARKIDSGAVGLAIPGRTRRVSGGQRRKRRNESFGSSTGEGQSNEDAGRKRLRAAMESMRLEGQNGQISIPNGYIPTDQQNDDPTLTPELSNNLLLNEEQSTAEEVRMHGTSSHSKDPHTVVVENLDSDLSDSEEDSNTASSSPDAQSNLSISPHLLKLLPKYGSGEPFPSEVIPSQQEMSMVLYRPLLAPGLNNETSDLAEDDEDEGAKIVELPDDWMEGTPGMANDYGGINQMGGVDSMDMDVDMES